MGHDGANHAKKIYPKGQEILDDNMGHDGANHAKKIYPKGQEILFPAIFRCRKKQGASTDALK